MLTPNVTGTGNAPTQQDKKSLAAAAATSASDFESFLTLLTAQLRNQDPLSPLDSTQFVQQLASFSAVEQQIETNRRLDDISAGLAASGLQSATQWIGKEVEAPVDAVHFSGEPLEFIPDSSPLGAPGEVIIRDAANAIVSRAQIPSDTAIFSWDGTDNSGFVVPQGDYRVSVSYVKDGEVVDTRAPLANSRVVEARMIDGGLRLILDNGGVIDPSALTAVREPAKSDALPGNV